MSNDKTVLSYPSDFPNKHDRLDDNGKVVDNENQVTFMYGKYSNLDTYVNTSYFSAQTTYMYGKYSEGH